MRGAGLQRQAAIGTLVGYAIGLPLSYVLGVANSWPTPLLGVWLGPCAALSFAALWASAVTLRTTWTEFGLAASMSPAARMEEFLVPKHAQIQNDEADAFCSPAA